MGRAFSWRSLTLAAVLLVTGLEAITPDPDDLASSVALRILGRQTADPRRSSDDDDADKSGAIAGCEKPSPLSTGRFAQAPRRLVTGPIPSAHRACPHRRRSDGAVGPAPSVLKSSDSGDRLNC